MLTKRTNWAYALIGLLCALAMVTQQADAGSTSKTAPWSQYIWSPTSRTVGFSSIHSTKGDVAHSKLAIKNKSSGAVLSGTNATLVLDAGQMTAGGFSIDLKASCKGSTGKATIGVAFSESEQFIGQQSDFSESITGGSDGYLNFTASCSWKTRTVDPSHIRGSFRYVTIFLQNGSGIEIRNSHVNFTPSPDVDASSLDEYTGHFYSSDDLLNQIFYAGVYTAQLCRIGGRQGRVAGLPYIPTTEVGWNNSGSFPPLAASDVVLVDGGKRDRNVAQGDYSVSGPTVYYSLNTDNSAAYRNALIALVYTQNKTDGLFFTAGPPLMIPAISDTYQLWVLSDMYDYYKFSNDLAWIRQNWAAFELGLKTPLTQVDDGLFNVVRDFDWGRTGTGGHNTEANAIFYKVLRNAADLATALRKTKSAQRYNKLASSLQANITSRLFDTTKGAYRDNDTAAGSVLYPQDGNSLAIRFGVETDLSRQQSISDYLIGNLNQYGSVNPEGQGLITPFISSHELEAHFVADRNANAYKQLRTMWGYMLSKYSQSTMIEGYDQTGTLHYPFYGNLNSYISHAHAWSTGPVTSLITHTVGLSNISSSNGGTGWAWSPSILDSGLTHVQGDFKADNLGTSSAAWQMSSKGDGSYTATVCGPAKAVGSLRLELPSGAAGSASAVSIKINGNVVFKNGKATAKNSSDVYFDKDTKRVVIENVTGGRTIQIAVQKS